MDYQLKAMLLDHSVSVIGGILGTLLGFRRLGPEPGINRKFDTSHAWWVKHLRWLGPLLIVGSIVHLAVSVKNIAPSVESAGGNNQAVQSVQNDVSTAGKLAEHDLTIEAPEGFKILIPKGFSYSKPSGTPFSLVAISDPNGAATPAFSVSVVNIDDSLDRTIEGLKSTVLAKNPTTKFSKTEAIESGLFKVYRTSVTSQRAGGYARGEMVFFSRGGKMFMLNCGTRQELYDSNRPAFEKIIRSFGPY